MVDRMHMSGFLAWLAWLFVHIWYLIGFRNRLVVMITWAWSYFTYRRGARLITGYGEPSAPLEASAARWSDPGNGRSDPGNAARLARQLPE